MIRSESRPSSARLSCWFRGKQTQFAITQNSLCVCVITCIEMKMMRMHTQTHLRKRRMKFQRSNAIGTHNNLWLDCSKISLLSSFPVFLSLLSRFRWQSTLSFRRYDMTELSLQTFSPLVPVIMFIMCSHSPRWLWMCVYCVCESVAMSNRSPSDNSGDEVKVCWARASLTHLHSPFSSSIYIHWFRMVYCYSRIFYVSQDWKCFFFSFASKINSSLYAYRDIHIRCVVTSKL